MPGRDQWQDIATAGLHNLLRESATFVGRAEQAEYVQGLLASTRLLTLVGSGGCGKTWLALQVAGQLLPDFADVARGCPGHRHAADVRTANDGRTPGLSEHAPLAVDSGQL